MMCQGQVDIWGWVARLAPDFSNCTIIPVARPAGQSAVDLSISKLTEEEPHLVGLKADGMDVYGVDLRKRSRVKPLLGMDWPYMALLRDGDLSE
jgi:hypothetical protein